MKPTVFGSRELFIQGTNKKILVEIEVPVACDESFACSYSISFDGSVAKKRTIFGLDALQSLFEATKLLVVDLQLIDKANGGGLRWSDAEGTYPWGFEVRHVP